MSRCPVCEDPGVAWSARAARPFTGQLRCRVCQCSLRGRTGARYASLRWLAWGTLGTGFAVALAIRESAVLIAATAAALGLEFAAGLELDERDAPSVRRAERIRRAIDRSSP